MSSVGKLSEDNVGALCIIAGSTHTEGRIHLNHRQNWRVALLGVSISALALLYIYRQINLEEFGRALISARYIYLLPCMLLLLAGLVTRALRWQVLLGGTLSLVHTFHIMNVAYLVNGILPLRIGEVARVYLASRVEPPVPVMKTTSTIITERLLDVLAVVCLTLIGLSAGPLPDQLRASAAFLGPIALLGFIILVILSGRRAFTEALLHAVVERFPLLERLQTESLAAHFMDGLAPLANPAAFGKALGWTVLSWGLSVAGGYVLMFTFFETASWVTTCLYIAAAAFVIAVPAVPGSIGPYELSIIVALNATGYGEPAAAASAFAFVVHGVNVFIHAVTGFIGLMHEGMTLERLSHGVSTM